MTKLVKVQIESINKVIGNIIIEVYKKPKKN